ncbi:hypothetical protein NQ314_012870 [Rhamnusium bicolor]|uniref:Uncharacterized protein n=1 Tax=Rhamnusium bicolor TaxID=1586634 RepID=A0AAV8XA50_9CUCU|nr:hypothetical protein NQ314_012870 [Rhamnusium bicolor]
MQNGEVQEKVLEKPLRRHLVKALELKVVLLAVQQKKKLAMRFRELTGEIEKTVPSISNNLGSSSRRALFHSPDCDKKSSIFLPSK